MSISTRFATTLLVLSAVSALPAQQQAPAPDPHPNRISLDVVVTPKSGAPVAGLQQSDFTVLDNKAAQPIATFNPVGGPQSPVNVLLVIDAVNTDFMKIAYERQQIDTFLRANGGHLAFPTSIAIFTDTGVQEQPGFSTDGNSLSASLDKADIGLRDIRRSAGFFGAEDRLSLSMNGFNLLARKESTLPGRKIVLWISPGWPLLSGPRVELDSKQQQQIFAQIVTISNGLRRAGITLYSVDPLGSGENVGYQFYYESFLKGVAKPGQVQPGDLALQVLAIQSGGQAQTASNDIASELKRCVDDAQAYYEISYDAPPSEHPDEYHSLEVKVSKPGLVARTRTGYYAEPTPANGEPQQP